MFQIIDISAREHTLITSAVAVIVVTTISHMSAHTFTIAYRLELQEWFDYNLVSKILQ